MPVIVDVVIIQRLCLCRIVTTTAVAGRQGGSGCRKGGMATSMALAATTTTFTMMTTIPRPSLLMSSSSGAIVFAVLEQQWRWDGDGVAVVDKAGRTAVNRDKRNGATCCNDDNNHPYPVVANVLIVWRLRLCGDGVTTAAAGGQQGGKDRGSGPHGPAVVGRGS